jgi:hypothetical protein
MNSKIACAAAGVVALLAFGNARAGSVYSSFGPGRTNCDCYSPFASGPINTPSFLPKGADWLAGTFKPKQSGALADIKLAIGLEVGYSGVIVVLEPDNGSGQPNSLHAAGLETWIVTKIPDAAFNQTPTTLISKAQPTLQAGQAYWIIVEPIGLDTLVTWWSSPKVKSGVLYSSTGGAGWSGYSSSQGAFEVDVK